MRSIAVVVTLAAALAVVPATASAHDYITETVPPMAPYMHDLEKVYDFGIIHGFRDGTFRPDQPVARAELWVAFNRFADVCRVRGLQLPNDLPPWEYTYGRGVLDHWGMRAWERLLEAYLVDRRPVAPVMDFDAPIKRIEFAELAVAMMRAYGVIPADLQPAELAIGEDIMVRQPDGKFHFHSTMPRWELAVGMSRLIDRISPVG